MLDERYQLQVPSKELGVGIAHPAFPHEINKIFEIVEEKPSAQTHLLWSMGLIPMQVSDDWSFVLDVYFCGLLQACIQFSSRSNIPYWKLDKYIRQLLGPNPFRAHDVIGAKGSNFLTWSCLHHLGKEYGPLFEPTQELEDRKESGQNWYPPNHFRPLVNWNLESEELEELKTIVYGALFQMSSIVLHEQRADLCTINSIGELCAQFTKGILANIRNVGAKEAVKTVKAYHDIFPEAAKTKWYPEAFDAIDTPEWQQLYVNAEHDGEIGVITISRESYNSDVDAELNRAISWLIKNGIKKTILTSDFHYSTQMVGADTTEFFPAITEEKEGERIAMAWSKTARRLYNDFDVSLGFISGKRCMGGMLELMMHCHYLFATNNTSLAMPEVTLPVVPGMEGCHWAIRKAQEADRPNLIKLLLDGKPIKAKETVGWLVDYADTLENSLEKAWEVMKHGERALKTRKVEEKTVSNIKVDLEELSPTTDLSLIESRKVLTKCIEDSCGTTIDEAISVQAKSSAQFMVSELCRKGKVGSEFDKISQN